jgi:murein DD-endopeptidase MepM/ murein hydrolase activator NlpD
MDLILLPRHKGRARHFDLAHPLSVAAVAILVLGILGAGFTLGIQLGARARADAPRADAAAWAGTMAVQKAEIAELKERLQERIDALAVRMGQVNAHVIRIDALGKRLIQMAKIDSREFNFDAPPPQGGPESDSDVAAQVPDLTLMIADLERRVDVRSAELAALENVILSRSLTEEIRPEGRPVEDGFISSYYGEREDPFTGHQAFHKGVDFASDSGSNVIAVAAGVVTFAGERSGYGELIELNHGNGLVTRYGHNEKVLVNVGETVTRGQAIALLGSTGRSTGPHVHFEVLRNGHQIDPLSFIEQGAMGVMTGHPPVAHGPADAD